ncbi:hypothetical protein Fleli_2386 [Bernardetia litoralis DSM 6794]|uniref:Uncharacterized protein n=1 Tax=Bernardetia litoralis (strain ATCC 23117 / DSM 6794 / NBRC 15988 / NCIMB 1366 / Fx l1 / Sio-4) TaxID=880071 RepID=I4ALC1_BERLS|nr:hypothetical protein [Bernardetia litoralis]AFM04756.1 hypothetical protein Fleli_2386 [Bernardetia litoralis DSM 6794]
MTVIEQKYLKVNKGIMTGSFVQLEIKPNDTEINRIIIDSERSPFRSQGLIEGGHKNWNESAKQALEVALKKINYSNKLDITVKKLEGRIFLDTNNASIGTACILALWKYLEFKPESEIMDKIHEFVKNDWKNEVELIPNFEKIFEK